MADIVSSDVTVTVIDQFVNGSAMVERVATLVFGDGALTYPAGGVPLPKAKMGCPARIVSLEVIGKATSGYEWSYNAATEKLVGHQIGNHTHNLLIIGGQAATTTNEVGHYATDILGKEAATNATILGADSATKGGVVSSGSGALAEPSAVAIAAQTVRVRYIGY